MSLVNANMCIRLVAKCRPSQDHSAPDIQTEGIYMWTNHMTEGWWKQPLWHSVSQQCRSLRSLAVRPREAVIISHFATPAAAHTNSLDNSLSLGSNRHYLNDRSRCLLACLHYKWKEAICKCHCQTPISAAIHTFTERGRERARVWR